MIASHERQSQIDPAKDLVKLSPEDLAAFVDVFRTLLEWERKYGCDMGKEKHNGSDHRQPGL